jgi:hypothetical protein
MSTQSNDVQVNLVVLKNGFFAQTKVVDPIFVVASLEVQAPPADAALAGCAKARVKKPAVIAAIIFLFN